MGVNRQRHGADEGGGQLLAQQGVGGAVGLAGALIPGAGGGGAGDHTAGGDGAGRGVAQVDGDDLQILTAGSLGGSHHVLGGSFPGNVHTGQIGILSQQGVGIGAGVGLLGEGALSQRDLGEVGDTIAEALVTLVAHQMEAIIGQSAHNTLVADLLGQHGGGIVAVGVTVGGDQSHAVLTGGEVGSDALHEHDLGAGVSHLLQHGGADVGVVGHDQQSVGVHGCDGLQLIVLGVVVHLGFGNGQHLNAQLLEGSLGSFTLDHVALVAQLVIGDGNLEVAVLQLLQLFIGEAEVRQAGGILAVDALGHGLGGVVVGLDVIAGVDGGAVRILVVVAGDQRQRHQQGQSQCQKLLHVRSPYLL